MLYILYVTYVMYSNAYVYIIIRYALLLKRSTIHKQQSNLYHNNKIIEPSYQVQSFI